MEKIINNNAQIIKQMSKHAEYVNAKIDRGIEENRKGLFNIQIVDENGELLQCDKVHVKQISHEFKFGAPLFVLNQLEDEKKNEKYKELYKKIFNYAIIPMYRKDVEPERGKYRFSKDSSFIWRRPPTDSVVEFCKGNNIRMKAHCLVYNSFNPDWLQGLSHREINVSIDEYMQAVSERYKKDIEDMDVINEMYSIYKNCYKGNGERDLPVANEIDHVSKMFRMARQYFPHTKLFWNEGLFESFGKGIYKGFRSQYYMMVKEQLEKGVPIEGLGMQYHMFCTQGTYWEQADYICNPLRMFDVLDCYSGFNLPIHISETSVPSYTNETQDEEMQAQITRHIYRLFFSHRNVENITWWNLVDKMALKGEDQFLAGLLREDLSIKPAFNVLDELINKEWHTEFDTKASEVIEFCGFYGDYEISFMEKGKLYKRQARLFRENTGYDNRLIAPRLIKIKK